METQADEIRTIVGGKEQPVWVFALIDVWSRLWLSTVVGKPSYQNTLTLFRDPSYRMNLDSVSLITTGGFQFYARAVRHLAKRASAVGSSRCAGRPVISGGWRLEQASRDSEDSVKLNTSFVERLNLTIRKDFRRAISQARWKERLEPLVAALPLQLRQASQNSEIRTCGQDAGYAGWSDPTAADVKGNLLFEDGLSGVDECCISTLQFRPGGPCGCLTDASGVLPTLDDRNTASVTQEAHRNPPDQ